MTPGWSAIEIIRGSAPDTVEVGWLGLELRNVKYNGPSSQGRLTYETMASEGYPKGVFSPSYFAGRF